MAPRMPSRNPPSAAPVTLPIPPRTAAVNAFSPAAKPRGRRGGARDPRPRRLRRAALQAEGGEDRERHERAEHEQVAVREVDQLDDPVDERVAEGDERDERSVAQADDERGGDELPAAAGTDHLHWRRRLAPQRPAEGGPLRETPPPAGGAAPPSYFRGLWRL